MTTFGIELERLTLEFINGVVETVRRHLSEQEVASKPVAPVQSEARAPRTVEPRISATTAEAPAPRIERKPPIRRRNTGARRRPAPVPAPEPTPPPIHFEVVPHPERRNRRLVVTRFDSKAHGTNGTNGTGTNGSQTPAAENASARSPEAMPPSSERPIPSASPGASSPETRAPGASPQSPAPAPATERFGDQVLVRWKR